MSSFTASGLRSVASKSETKSASASKVARAGPTPQNGSAILRGDRFLLVILWLRREFRVFLFVIS